MIWCDGVLGAFNCFFLIYHIFEHPETRQTEEKTHEGQVGRFQRLLGASKSLMFETSMTSFMTTSFMTTLSLQASSIRAASEVPPINRRPNGPRFRLPAPGSRLRTEPWLRGGSGVPLVLGELLKNCTMEMNTTGSNKTFQDESS